MCQQFFPFFFFTPPPPPPPPPPCLSLSLSVFFFSVSSAGTAAVFGSTDSQIAGYDHCLCVACGRCAVSVCVCAHARAHGVCHVRVCVCVM